jgi:predicted dehydrogenase
MITRRNLVKGAALALAAPYVVPASVLGRGADPPPSDVPTLGCIGVGRMGSGDMRSFLGKAVRIVAVCDVDANRRDAAKKVVDDAYAAKAGAGSARGCAAYTDYREVIARPDIDIVSIVTPDHWHCIPAVAAAEAGKDIFVQKPLSYAISEGRAVADAVRRYGRVLQVGSQQRSETRFRTACELVRNGRIGKLRRALVTLDTDPACGLKPPMPVPPGLDYDFWLGPAPWAPYTEDRVHPQKGYGRPGWLRMADYSGGMLTGWGTHHVDIAQWGMDTELTGPIEVEGTGVFPTDGLWDVHGKFHLECKYANGLRMTIQDGPDGIRFEGTDGWVFVDRSRLDAEPKRLLKEEIGAAEIHLYRSNDHKQNFLDCVRSRAEPIAAAEIGHRSATVCHLANIVMLLGRALKWDPAAERFIGDSEADTLLARPMRAPWRI